MAASPRFYLEPIDEAKHLAGVHTLWSDPANVAGIGIPPITSLSDNRAWLVSRSKHTHPDIENYAIMAPASSPLYGLTPNTSTTTATAPAPSPALEPASDDADAPPAKLIGLVGVIRVSPPEVGWILDRPYWGRGVATEAVRAFLPLYWALQPGVGAVFAYINEGHGASERVAGKVGFARDAAATLPVGERLPSGQVADVPVGVWVLKRPSGDGGEEEKGVVVGRQEGYVYYTCKGPNGRTGGRMRMSDREREGPK